MSKGLARKVVAIVLLHALWPTLVLAQAPAAGVVTTLSGQATVARVATTQELPLKFKDNVFYRDRISTRERSTVRVLLGGKALITVRELSVLTITEETGRATIDLDSGKIALVAARQRMRPGEVIEIRTPNAIAAVRGTVVIVEVSRTSAASHGQSGGVLSAVHFVSGNGDVRQHLDPPDKATPLPGGFSVNVTAAVGQLFTNPPLQQLFQGLGAPFQFIPGTSSQIIDNQQGQFSAVASTIQTGQIAPTNLPQGFQPSQDQPRIIPEIIKGRPDSTPKNGGLPPLWEPNFGAVRLTCDDCTTNIQFGFNFPFQGGNFADAELSSDGFLSLGGSNGSGCCDASVAGFLGGARRIAVAWYDLDSDQEGGGGAIRYNTFPNKAVVTWDNVPEFSNVSGNRFQAQLFSNGKIIFSYDRLNPNADEEFEGHRHHALIGVTPGGGAADPGEVNFSNLISFNSGSVGTIYEFFARGPNGSAEVGGDTFDLDGMSLIFTPTESGGWELLVDDVNSFLSLGKGDVIIRQGSGPLVQLAGTALTTGGYFLEQSGGSLVSLRGPFFSATDSPLNLSKGLLGIGDGSRLIVTDSMDPLISIIRGTHFIATDVAAAIIDLKGTTTAVDPETGLTIGTEKPFQINGAALETTGATIGSDAQPAQKGFRIDTALFEASAPLFNLKANSSLTTNSHAVDLSFKAKVASLGPVARLDASSLTVKNGAAFNVGGGSYLRVTGDFVHLTNTSTLSVLSGAFLAVNGVVNISGALIGFGSGANAVNITNGLCPCTSIGGIPVALTNGAVANNVSITNPIKDLGGGGSLTQNLSNRTLDAGGTAVITVSGANSKVTISGN